MAWPAFTIHTFDIDSNSNERVIPYETLMYKHIISDAGECSATMADYEPTGKVINDNIAAAQRHIEIYRDSVRVWAGRIWDTSTDTAGLVSFAAKGYYELFRRKFLIPKDHFKWLDKDTWVIAKDVIDYIQSLRDMGITFGMAGESGKPHVGDFRWHWWDFESAADVIERLATLQGKAFYFRIDENRVWLTYTKPGPETEAFKLTGGVDGNIHRLTINRSGVDTAREALVRGDGTGVDTHYGHTLLDEEADVWGRLMVVIDRPDVKSDNTLQDLADLAAERHSNVRIQLEAEVEVGPDAPYSESAWENFGPGESIQVTYDDGGFPVVDDYFRVAAKTVTVDKNGASHSITFDTQWDSQV